MSKERLLVFDLLKVIAIPLIVFQHIPDLSAYNTDKIVLPAIGNLGLGRIGVIIFVFTSGAILYYNHEKINGLGTYLFRRISRLYPAFWMSVLLGMFTFSFKWEYQTPLKVLDQFTGLTIYTPVGQSALFNPAGWYIGMILALYLAYPLLAKLFEKQALATTIVVAGASLLYRAITFGLDMPVLGLDWYYSPISNVGFFVLGMAAVKYGIYPELRQNKAVSILADLSFYVFLVNIPLILYWFNDPLIYLAITLLASILLMVIDKKIQQIIGGLKLPEFDFSRPGTAQK